jgi:RNA methyltransferase, TrmH family
MTFVDCVTFIKFSFLSPVFCLLFIIFEPMLSKSQIKKLRSLQRKKERKSLGLYIVEGRKIVEEILQMNPSWFEVFATSNWFDQHKQLAGLENSFLITEKELSQVSTLKTPNEVLLVLKQRSEIDFSEVKSVQLVLALDGVKDPGNMGTIIRLADWFGVQHILCTSNSVDQYNPKTVQSAMGSINKVQLHYGDLAQMLSDIDSFQIYACDLDGESIYETQFVEKTILIMGSESHGISDEILDMANRKITIPSVSNSGIDSLNVATATAISLSVFSSQSSLF